MNDVLQNVLSVATQVGILFILIVVGMLITKFKIVTKKGIDQIIDILLYVVTPCLIVNSFITVKFTKETVIQLLMSAGCAVITHIIGIIVVLLFTKVKPVSKKAVYKFGTVLSNGGFMSLPLAQALVGEKGVFLVSAYVIVFNIVVWTYGVSLFKSEEKASKLKILLNPGVIGVIIGLPLFLLKIQFPQIIMAPIAYLADLNTTLAMLVTGYFLMNSGIKDGISDIKMWLSAGLRLIVIPLVAVIIFKYALNLSGDLLICATIPACAPTAVNTMMISAKFGGDTALASKVTAFISVLSILTMPVMIALAQSIQ